MSLLMLNIYLLPEAKSAACWGFPGGSVGAALAGLAICEVGLSNHKEDIKIPPAIIPFD